MKLFMFGLKSVGFPFEEKGTVKGNFHSVHVFSVVVFVLQRQGSGAAAGNNKTSGGQGE